MILIKNSIFIIINCQLSDATRAPPHKDPATCTPPPAALAAAGALAGGGTKASCVLPGKSSQSYLMRGICCEFGSSKYYRYRSCSQPDRTYSSRGYEPRVEAIAIAAKR